MTDPAPGHITRADPGWLAREGLHVYGQAVWHEEVWIVGGMAALNRLAGAISAAMDVGHVAGTYYVNDGEGYDLHVICEPIDQRHAVPYTEEMAIERRDDARTPDDAAMEKGWKPE